MRRNLLIALLLVWGAILHAQNVSVIFVTSDPSGACSPGPPLQYNVSNGKQWGCDGTWTQVGGGGATGFPITIGSTSIAAGSTTTSISGLTLVAPALGTPTALVLTNATGLPAAQLLAGALANGMTGTTQTAASNDTKLATDAYVDNQAGPKLGGSFSGGTAASPFVPILTAPTAGVINSCTVTTTASDPSTALTLNILKGGVSILNAGSATIAAGTASGTQTALTLTGAITVAKNDKWQINVTSLASAWQWSLICNQ